jgi:hypothetical protein
LIEGTGEKWLELFERPQSPRLAEFVKNTRF